MKSFANWDVYYLYEYVYSFKLHGDGEMFLIYFENETDRLCYVVMQKDIEDSSQFSKNIKHGKYYDWETPYGYGGPLVDREMTSYSKKLFFEELKKYCIEHHIVSQFVRFHPLLQNNNVIPELIETRYLRDTIFIDTSVSKDQIMMNMDSKNRNMVRKAIKNEIQIVSNDITELDEFIPIYNETMINNQAEEYYFFDEKYFLAQKELKDHARVFYALYEGKVISGAIIYYNDRFAHYHLSGSRWNYRKYAPSNLLLYEVACWASEKGIQFFHLGGGIEPDDSLFGFKKQFNKKGRLPFVVGRTIFWREAYDKLLHIRKKQNPNFDIDNNFMIQYRR